MKKIRASVVVPGRAREVEALWLDRSRWASWIEGFAHVVLLEGEWPRPGARLRWSSVPRGRGLVEERALEYSPAERIVVAVEDEKLRGTRRVQFAALEDGVRIELSLSYELKERNVVTALTDLAFIRRAIRDSLRRELARFARELETERDL
jgi:hypothetical protein